MFFFFKGWPKIYLNTDMYVLYLCVRQWTLRTQSPCRVLAFLGLVQFFHNAALMSLSLPLLLSLHVPVSAASPLSNDVSCEDCFWREKLQELYCVWFLKYGDSQWDVAIFRVRLSLSDWSDRCFKNAGKTECYFYHYYSNRLPCGLTTGSLGATNITAIAVIV